MDWFIIVIVIIALCLAYIMGYRSGIEHFEELLNLIEIMEKELEGLKNGKYTGNPKSRVRDDSGDMEV